MKAQFYLEDPVVRIFPDGFEYALLDCHIHLYGEVVSIKDANYILEQCHLKRLGKWARREWGYETKVVWKK